MGLKTVLVALVVPAICNAAAIPQDVHTDGVSIVGGVAAQQGDFPFIVSLQMEGRGHICGGSLLNANTVLTAGHCTRGSTASSWKVRAGSLKINSGGTLVGVSSFTIHPNFTYLAPDSDLPDSDVAIFKLATAIPSSSTIGYATLPASGSDPVAGSMASVAGWGTTVEDGFISTILRKVDVPIISREECRADYSVFGDEVTDDMFCAGLKQGGRDACQGDSGSPIVDSASRVLLGTVSWGRGCAQVGKPGVYARVGSLLSFIQSNL